MSRDVLIVDDDDKITNLIQKALNRAGFNALMALSADEALRIIQNTGNKNSKITKIRRNQKIIFFLFFRLGPPYFSA